MAVVLTTAAWMAVLALIGLAGGLGCAVFAVLAAQNFGTDLCGALFRKVQALSFGNLDRLETGTLITRLTNDVIQVQEVVMMLLRIMVRVPLLLAGSLVMAVLTSPQLAVLFVVLIPIVVLTLAWIIGKTLPLFSFVQQRLDALNIVLQENLAGVRVVRAFAREDFERERFGRANDRLMNQNLAAVRLSAVTMPVMMLTLNGGVVSVLWIGGVRVSAGSLQPGRLIAFINYLIQTLMSLMMISMLLVRLSRAEASAKRIQEVLETEPEVRARPDARTLQAIQGRVAFEHVWFSYGGQHGDPVLQDITFVAEAGQTVALLGATGAGKSTLVQLIPRFYDVTAGRVTIDGVDVRMLDEAVLRRAVAIVLQETILFSGTIRENIRYGRPDASDVEVIAAAKIAQAHDFVTQLPNGYDTIVGQRGVNLSGGQKQRIAIARALVMQPAVLILTIRKADQILVINQGEIVERGTHEELLARQGFYARLYASQFLRAPLKQSAGVRAARASQPPQDGLVTR
mgnify:CR=1 FL=1